MKTESIIYVINAVGGEQFPDMPGMNKDKHLRDTKEFRDEYNERRLRNRIWGYYRKRKHAEQAIEGNLTDMSEMGYYKYAVLVRCRRACVCLARNFSGMSLFGIGMWSRESTTA